MVNYLVVLILIYQFFEVYRVGPLRAGASLHAPAYVTATYFYIRLQRF